MTIEERLAGPLRIRTEIVSGFADYWPDIVIGGRTQPAYWNDHVYAVKGEAITVLREVDPNGVARNVVIGRIGRPGAPEGTVISTDGSKAVVSVGSEEIIAAYNTALTLTGGDTVRLLWQGREATVLAKLTSYVPPPVYMPGNTEPPPATSSGELPVFASDSATFSPALKWNGWAGGNQRVYQGNYNGNELYGAWFYNGATRQLEGATVGVPRFYVPKRRSVGNFNQAGTLHVYVHNADTRPEGNVDRIAGPFDLEIPAGFSGGFRDLPQQAANLLKNGGGICILGNPYMGFVGKAEDPSSGQLLIPWTR